MPLYVPKFLLVCNYSVTKPQSRGVGSYICNHSAVLEIRITAIYRKYRDISLDSPLEMYSKFVLAYQFWSAKS